METTHSTALAGNFVESGIPSPWMDELVKYLKSIDHDNRLLPVALP